MYVFKTAYIISRNFFSLKCRPTTSRCHNSILINRFFRNMGSHSVTFRNKLGNEKSPYLLQHASNPVDWYPWGEEAFSKAKSENKLIFLSVGYSTCHWCHVMERESFEDKDISNIMNQHFINIKVDREERPDVDRTYMAFVQGLSGGRGGWPMSVWLTPDLKPIFGGTYFPPHSNYGISSFSSVLTNLATKWQSNPERFIDSSHKIHKMLKETIFVPKKVDFSDKSQLPDLKCINLIVQQLAKSFDNIRGGFIGAPKFPQPVNFNLLLQIYQRNKDTDIGKEALKMTEITLKKMSAGGIHDHIGKGFARYSVDSEWHIPHFEKMLYDQAQLCSVYAQMYQVSGDSFYADIVQDICEYVNRDLSHPTGGCYSAEDADSLPDSNSKEKREGAFYVWTYSEIYEILEEYKIPNSNISLAELFCYHFNAKQDGNVKSQQDPHGELINQNVLIIRGSLRETAENFKMEEHIIADALKVAKVHLFHSRLKRPRPGLDDKMISSWNGLMLSAFSKASQSLGDDALKERALKLGHFIRKNLASEDGSTLLRSCYRSAVDNGIVYSPIPISGFLDDYAFVIRGLLDLYETCLEPEWLDWAVQLQETQDNLFWDENNLGYFFTSSEDETTLFRLKEEQDGAEPSGNSVAASNLFRLASLLDSDEMLKRCESLVYAFSPTLQRTPLVTPEMCSVVQSMYHGPIKVILTGPSTAENMKKILSLIHLRLLPGLALAAIDPSCPPKSLHKIALQFPLPQNQQMACYVCSGRTCSLPTLDLKKLTELLDDALIYIHIMNGLILC